MRTSTDKSDKTRSSLGTEGITEKSEVRKSQTRRRVIYKDMTQWSKPSEHVHLWQDISPHVNKWFRKYIEMSLFLLLHCFLLFCLFYPAAFLCIWLECLKKTHLTIQRHAFISFCCYSGCYRSIPVKMFLSEWLMVFVSRCHQKGIHSCQQCRVFRSLLGRIIDVLHPANWSVKF